MIRAKDLRGRSVVHLDTAERLGEIDELIFDPDNRRVAGLIIVRRPSFLHGNRPTVVPATAIQAIGPDAVTVRAARGEVAQVDPGAEDALATLPRLANIVGRQVVSHGGKRLGAIDDVLIEGENGHILGYLLEDPNTAGRVRSVAERSRSGQMSYVRADTDLRVGERLVVVPDEAVVHVAAGEDATASYWMARAFPSERPDAHAG